MSKAKPNIPCVCGKSCIHLTKNPEEDISHLLFEAAMIEPRLHRHISPRIITAPFIDPMVVDVTDTVLNPSK